MLNQKLEFSNSDSEWRFCMTCLCITSYEHFISFHCTTCHFEIQNSWFSKMSIQIRVLNISKLISNSWVFKIANSPLFTSRAPNYKSFSQENDLDSFRHWFSGFRQLKRGGHNFKIHRTLFQTLTKGLRISLHFFQNFTPKDHFLLSLKYSQVLLRVFQN